ncbi:MAG: flavodoxin family protein [Syntrophomonas sp.]
MKIVAINGSPRGTDSTSIIMIDALTKYMADCAIVHITLADHDLQNCRGCYSCWINGSGCVIDDDFNKIVALADGADLIVFASPVYFKNLTGLLKNFIDRLTSTGSPHVEKKGESPAFVMLSNSGFPYESEFEVISLWIKKFSASMNSTLAGEFYFPGGKSLKEPTDEAAIYLDNLAQSGRNIVHLLTESAVPRFPC